MGLLLRRHRNKASSSIRSTGAAMGVVLGGGFSVGALGFGEMSLGGVGMDLHCLEFWEAD